jgi:two-component system phosphate regulon response regulator PhoB
MDATMPQLVLIVDDDQMNRELLETVIKRAGFAVSHANSGTQALRMVESQPPDLILLDVRLGEMSGFDVCARLKSEPATRPIPIMILTAADNQEDRQNALRVGAEGFFPKMQGWQPLIEQIKQMLGQTSA